MGRKGVATAATASMLAATVAAVGLAGPAHATDQITQNAVGTYEVKYPWGTNTWVVTPCADNAVQCVKVTEFGAGDTERKYPGWSGNAYWQVGWWIMKSVDTPDALTCDDGTKHSLPMNYSWDAAANNGWRSYREPGICSGDAYSGANPIELIKIGPPPPV